MIFGISDVSITKATPSDIDALKRIADAHRHELGFLRRPSLLEAIRRSEIITARENGNIVGFVEYRHRQDEQTTLYNIAVNPEYRGIGIGRALVQSLVEEVKERNKQYILLKCPEDLPANEFYRALGFHLLEIESGKKRKLMIWRWELISVQR